MYASRFSRFCHGGVGMLSGVVHEDWIEEIMACGFVVISFVTGSWIVCRFG